MSISRIEYNRRKDLKLCIECKSSELYNNTLKCKKCSENNSKATKKHRTRMIAEGRCPCSRERESGYTKCLTCLKGEKISGKKSGLNKKLKVFEAYGGICECCGENEINFLQIDHIAGRTNENDFKGVGIYTYLINNKYPKGFRLLCADCNWSRGMYGECPHQTNLKNNVLARCIQV